MSIEMSKTKRFLAVVAIMATAIAVMADLPIIPVIKLLYQSYPDSMGYVNYFVSGPMLVVLFASLLTSVLLKKLNKKTVMIAGGVIFAVGAIFGVMIDDLLYMCIMRTLVGIGAGVTNVVAVALISDLYEDGGTRAKITGYYNATLSVVGTIFSFAGGILATNNPWQNVFQAYWSAIPMLILLILFIPSIKPNSALAQNAAADKAEKKEPIGWRFWWMSFSWFVMNIAMGGTVLYYLSPYIFENNLGGPDFIGTAAGIKSLVGFLLCLAFGFIYIKLKRQTISVSYFIAFVSLLLLVVYPSAGLVLSIGTFGAIMYKFGMSYAYAHGFNIVHKSRYDDAVSITTAVYGIGSFLSTYYATWLLDLMKTDSFTKTWMISTVILGVMFVAEVLVSIVEKKKSAQTEKTATV